MQESFWVLISANGRLSCIVMLALTHWGRVTDICVSKLTIISSDNEPMVILWTNAEILLIGPLGTNFSEILIEIGTFSFKKMHLKVSSAKRRPFCLCLNLLIGWAYTHNDPCAHASHNTQRSRQNGHQWHFDMHCVWNFHILINFSLKYALRGQ